MAPGRPNPPDDDAAPQGGLGLNLGIAIGRRWTPIAVAASGNTPTYYIYGF